MEKQQYSVQQPIRLEGITYNIGDLVSLNSRQAVFLLTSGQIKPVQGQQEEEA